MTSTFTIVQWTYNEVAGTWVRNSAGVILVSAGSQTQTLAGRYEDGRWTLYTNNATHLYRVDTVDRTATLIYNAPVNSLLYCE